MCGLNLTYSRITSALPLLPQPHIYVLQGMAMLMTQIRIHTGIHMNVYGNTYINMYMNMYTNMNMDKYCV